MVPQTMSRSGGLEKSVDHRQLSMMMEAVLVICVTLALLVPCVWHDHIQAGDLSSHLYNAWLAGQIKSGAVQGLAIKEISTNTLTNWIMEAALPSLGVAGTEKLVVGACVLVFFWGAFYFIQTFIERRPWPLAPCIAMLTYGLVFHFGFLNFYLSVGLCFWALALLWRPAAWKIGVAAALLVLAFFAHALPVAWAVLVFVYLQGSKMLPPSRWFIMPMIGLLGLLLVQTALISLYPYRWSLDDLMSLSGVASLTGVEQVWLFGPKYLVVVAGLFLLWCMMFLQRLDEKKFLVEPMAQLWVLHVIALALLPSAILFPGYQHVLAYIPQRFSLITAVILIVAASGSRYGRGTTRVAMVVATVYFTFLYLDDRAFNAAENDVTEIVSTLPPGQRVVAAISDTDARLNAMMHVVDRACIGHCFSFANYEPATAQFRIRVNGPNPIVASTMKEVQEFEHGGHVVTESEAPLYSVCVCERPEAHQFCLKKLSAGERTCEAPLPLSLRLNLAR